MKYSTLIPLALLLCVGLTLSLSAGPLTPPAGPITSTGRFGPRIDVLTLPGATDAVHEINTPGSYYLSGPITGEAGKHGINIRAGSVTLDLNGFRLIGVPGSLHGIRSSSVAPIVVRNGVIRDFDGSGVSLRGNQHLIEDISARGNGAWGIDGTDNGASVQLHVNVVGCRVQGNGGTLAGTGGIRVSPASIVSGCTVLSNTGTGIFAAFSSNISNNIVADSSVGVDAASCLLRANVVSGSSNNTAGSTLVNNRGI